MADKRYVVLTLTIKMGLCLGSQIFGAAIDPTALFRGEREPPHKKGCVSAEA